MMGSASARLGGSTITQPVSPELLPLGDEDS